jgi:hypothetical protein
MKTIEQIWSGGAQVALTVALLAACAVNVMLLLGRL